MRRTGSTMERSSMVPVATAGSRGVYCIWEASQHSARAPRGSAPHIQGTQRQRITEPLHRDVYPLAIAPRGDAPLVQGTQRQRGTYPGHTNAGHQQFSQCPQRQYTLPLGHSLQRPHGSPEAVHNPSMAFSAAPARKPRGSATSARCSWWFSAPVWCYPLRCVHLPRIPFLTFLSGLLPDGYAASTS